jgi:hypothetical protein
VLDLVNINHQVIDLNGVEAGNDQAMLEGKPGDGAIEGRDLRPEAIESQLIQPVLVVVAQHHRFTPLKSTYRP